MKLKNKVDEGVLVASVDGEIISLDDSKELVAAVESHLIDGNKNVIIDLAKVKYINSAGINILITILTSIRNKEGELVLASISEKVKSLLVITKLNSIFNVKDSIDESFQLLKEMATLEMQQEDKPI